jgi:hypothetical protein
MDASWVAVVLAPILGLVGVLIGGLSLRSKDVREMRRRAYVEWQQAAEFFPFFDQSQGFDHESPDHGHAQEDQGSHDGDGGSWLARCDRCGNGFVAVVTGSGYVQTMNAAKLQTVEDTLRLHDKLTGATRSKDAAGDAARSAPLVALLIP